MLSNLNCNASLKHWGTGSSFVSGMYFFCTIRGGTTIICRNQRRYHPVQTNYCWRGRVLELSGGSGGAGRALHIARLLPEETAGEARVEHLRMLYIVQIARLIARNSTLRSPSSCCLRPHSPQSAGRYNSISLAQRALLKTACRYGFLVT